jgi:hypothetical protein
MKQKLLLVCLAIGIVGCGSMPVDELDYIGELPPGVVADFTVAKQFAADLATEANLKIIEEHPDRWAASGDITLSMTDKGTFTHRENVPVYVRAGNKPKRELVVTVNGDVNDPNAQAIGAKAQEIFTRTYPGFKLVRFIRYQGLAP